MKRIHPYYIFIVLFLSIFHSSISAQTTNWGTDENSLKLDTLKRHLIGLWVQRGDTSGIIFQVYKRYDQSAGSFATLAGASLAELYFPTEAVVKKWSLELDETGNFIGKEENKPTKVDFRIDRDTFSIFLHTSHSISPQHFERLNLEGRFYDYRPYLKQLSGRWKSPLGATICFYTNETEPDLLKAKNISMEIIRNKGNSNFYKCRLAYVPVRTDGKLDWDNPFHDPWRLILEADVGLPSKIEKKYVIEFNAKKKTMDWQVDSWSDTRDDPLRGAWHKLK